MGLSKTEFLLTITIFYAVLGVFMGLLGSLQLDDSPSINYQNAINSDDSSLDVSPCSPTYNRNGEYSIIGNIFPNFLKPKCISSVTETSIEGLNGNVYDSDGNIIAQEHKFNFLPNVVQGFSSVPAWLNLILFTPLAIALLFIIITTLGGVLFDGGS